ncbi:hypothetical protein HD554DRAFT_2168692 [Boletus coccyginus]|nr:hypothetical protein HD554DRAFT_2168692 [Boletus coccyginus]
MSNVLLCWSLISPMAQEKDTKLKGERDRLESCNNEYITSSDKMDMSEVSEGAEDTIIQLEMMKNASEQVMQCLEKGGGKNSPRSAPDDLEDLNNNADISVVSEHVKNVKMQLRKLQNMSNKV